jgi:hypothetical protein
MERKVNNATRMLDFAICEIAIQSQPLNQALIKTVDPMPFRGIEDRDLES